MDTITDNTQVADPVTESTDELADKTIETIIENPTDTPTRASNDFWLVAHVHSALALIATNSATFGPDFFLCLNTRDGVLLVEVVDPWEEAYEDRGALLLACEIFGTFTTKRGEVRRGGFRLMIAVDDRHAAIYFVPTGEKKGQIIEGADWHDVCGLKTPVIDA